MFGRSIFSKILTILPSQIAKRSVSNMTNMNLGARVTMPYLSSTPSSFSSNIKSHVIAEPLPKVGVPSIMELFTGLVGPQSVTEYVEPITNSETLQMDSVKRKRKKMMKKHKLRKRRKAQRALKIRLKK